VRTQREREAGGEDTNGEGRPRLLASSHHQCAHGVQHPAERIEHQAEDLERDDAEQRFRVAGLAEDDRGVTLALGQREVAFRDGPADRGAVGEHEFHLALGREADGLPHRLGEERVGGPAVDQEADAGFRARRTADGTLDVADAHAPEDGVPGAERRHRKIAARREDTPVLPLHQPQPRMSSTRSVTPGSLCGVSVSPRPAVRTVA